MGVQYVRVGSPPDNEFRLYVHYVSLIVVGLRYSLYTCVFVFTVGRCVVRCVEVGRLYAGWDRAEVGLRSIAFYYWLDFTLSFDQSSLRYWPCRYASLLTLLLPSSFSFLVIRAADWMPFFFDPISRDFAFCPSILFFFFSLVCMLTYYRGLGYAGLSWWIDRVSSWASWCSVDKTKIFHHDASKVYDVIAWSWLA